MYIYIYTYNIPAKNPKEFSEPGRLGSAGEGEACGLKGPVPGFSGRVRFFGATDSPCQSPTKKETKFLNENLCL